MYAASQTAVPGYCTSGSGDIPTPAQWETCLKAGWNAPTTGAAHAGYATGHTGAPVLIGIAVIVLILLAISRAGKGSSAAPQRS